MSSDLPRSRDIGEYIALIDAFISNKIDAPEFEAAYLKAIKFEQRMLVDEVFSILQELFEDADAYVPYPELRTDPEDLDDAQLRECAIRARRSLNAIGYS